MGIGKSAPSPPDPAQTAAAQATANKEGAIATARLNQINEYGPYGSAVYSPTGQTADGIDLYQRTISLSPEEQAKYNAQNQIAQQLLGIGGEQLGRIGTNFGTPFSYEGLPMAPEASDTARQRVEQALYGRLEPQFARDEAALQNRLANQGITPGSEAYNRAIDAFNRAKNDARLAVTAQGGQEMANLFGLQQSARNQAIQEMLTQRNQPVNELSALLGLSGGVNQPNVAGVYQGAGIAPADITGPTALAYQGALNNYNQQMGQGNALMGGLFGLGGSLGAASILAPAAAASDIRVKTDIRRVGTLDNGLPVYAFKYKSGGPTQLGVMAQDVQETHPEAVVDVGGILHVNYDEAVKPTQQPLHGQREAF